VPSRTGNTASPSRGTVLCRFAQLPLSRWELRDGASDYVGWLKATYGDRSLVARIGTLHADHADHADLADWPTGLPTSSATLPGLIVQMFRHGYISDSIGLHPDVAACDATGPLPGSAEPVRGPRMAVRSAPLMSRFIPNER